MPQADDDCRPTFPLLDKANWHLMLLKTGLECSSTQKRTALLVVGTQNAFTEQSP